MVRRRRYRHDGVWHGRTFAGTWYDGEWHGGDFYGGVWLDGIWHNGSWSFGEWVCGEWKKTCLILDSHLFLAETNVSPKCFRKPVNTLSLNYAKYG